MGSLDLDSSSDSEGEARRPTNSMSDSNSDNEPSSGNNVAARIDSSDRYLTNLPLYSFREWVMSTQGLFSLSRR